MVAIAGNQAVYRGSLSGVRIQSSLSLVVGRANLFQHAYLSEKRLNPPNIFPVRIVELCIMQPMNIMQRLSEHVMRA